MDNWRRASTVLSCAPRFSPLGSFTRCLTSAPGARTQSFESHFLDNFPISLLNVSSGTGYPLTHYTTTQRYMCVWKIDAKRHFKSSRHIRVCIWSYFLFLGINMFRRDFCRAKPHKRSYIMLWHYSVWPSGSDYHCRGMCRDILADQAGFFTRDCSLWL